AQPFLWPSALHRLRRQARATFDRHTWPEWCPDPARGSSDVTALLWCRICCAKTFPRCHQNCDPALGEFHSLTAKPLFCHTRAENEPLWCNITGIRLLYG